MTCTNLRRYVVHLQPNAKVKAVGHLTRQGFATYLPRYFKRWRYARRVEIVHAPLFLHYLFVPIDMTVQRWRSIYSTISVARLGCNGERPTRISERVMMALRARESDSGFVGLDRRLQLRTGDKTRALDGIFTDSLGLIDGMADRDHVAIFLDLLGRKVRVLLEAEAVTVA